MWLTVSSLSEHTHKHTSCNLLRLDKVISKSMIVRGQALQSRLMYISEGGYLHQRWNYKLTKLPLAPAGAKKKIKYASHFLKHVYCLNSDFVTWRFYFPLRSFEYKDRLIFITIYYLHSSLIPFFVEIDINIVAG